MPAKKTVKKIKNERKNRNLETDLYNTSGKIVGKIRLPSEIFKSKVDSILISQAVKVYLANKRQGTHSTKTRSAVSGSGKKIYRQKGTGRARHGDIRAPIFRGGGVVHGPQPRDYSRQLPTKMKRKALFGSLTDRFQSEKIKVVKGFSDLKPKTKEMVKVLANFKIELGTGKKRERVLLILPEKIDNVVLAGRNLPYIKTIEARLLNTYEVIRSTNLLFMQEAILKLKETFLRDNQKEDVGAETVAKVINKKKLSEEESD